MPDIVATLLDLTTNWPATYFQTVLPSCDLAADHREREREETALIHPSAAIRQYDGGCGL